MGLISRFCSTPNVHENTRVEDRTVLRRAAALLCFLVALLGAVPTEAQDLAELLRAERFRAVSAEKIAQKVMPADPARIHAPVADSLWAWVQRPQARPQTEELAPLPFEVTERRAFGRLERPVFERRFGETPWAYLGAEGRSLLDTTRTVALRARLEAQFGPPTFVLADLERPRAGKNGEFIQFEYWFAVNDTIPVVVMDTGGPFDRGLVIASHARYRDRLPALRAALLEPIVASDEHAAFLDFFYDPEAGQWYHAGFDGRSFFTRPVPYRRLIPGRRPWIEPVSSAP